MAVQAATGGEHGDAVQRVPAPEEATEQYTGPVEEDLGNLLVNDSAPLEETLHSEEALSKHARDVLQHLVNKLFKQETYPAEGFGRMAKLPTPTTQLPRQKPMPEPRPLTRFERFARRKGMPTKKKRSKLVWDESEQRWKRRHGKDRVSREQDIAVKEASENDQPGSTDPFTRLEQERKQRTKAQKGREERNLREMYAKGGSKALPANVSIDASAAAAPESNSKSTSKAATAAPKEPSRSKQKREELSVQTAKVAEATASMGKFDKMQPGEPDSARSKPGKHRQLDPVTASAKTADQAPDVQRSKRLASRIASGEDIVQADKARRVQQQQEEASGRKRKRDGGEDEDDDEGDDSWRKRKKQGLQKQRQAGKKAAKSTHALKKQHNASAGGRKKTGARKQQQQRQSKGKQKK